MITDNLLRGIDQDALLKHITSINPMEVLGKLGYDDKESNQILKGDMSPVIDKSSPILDYSIILHNYGKHLNENLIKYFFKKAKEGEFFTEDEIKNYSDTYQKWFDLVFKIGETFIFETDKEIHDKSIIIQVGDDKFQMSIIDDNCAIIYLKNQKGSIQSKVVF